MPKLCRVTKVNVFFLVLVYVFNFKLFEFSATILEKGLFYSDSEFLSTSMFTFLCVSFRTQYSMLSHSFSLQEMYIFRSKCYAVTFSKKESILVQPL